MSLMSSHVLAYIVYHPVMTRYAETCRNEHINSENSENLFVSEALFQYSSLTKQMSAADECRQQAQLLRKASSKKLWLQSWKITVCFVFMEKQAKDHERSLTQKCPNSLLGPRMASSSYLCHLVPSLSHLLSQSSQFCSHL
jgi:hypothetical protein